MRLALRRFLGLTGLLLFVLLCAGLAGSNFSRSSTTFRPVTTTADSGPGSLRAAIEAAGDGDVIYFSDTLDGQTINLTSGELAINSNITIRGGNQITVQRSSSSSSPFRLFHVLPGNSVTIQDLTLKEGRGDGAKVRNDGSTLNLLNCTLTGQDQGGGNDYGGAIYNDGSTGSATLTIIDCIITNNYARHLGGGIYNNGNGGSAIVSMWNTRVTGNFAYFFGTIFGDGYGGGIANVGAGASMTLTNSVVSGNSSGLVQQQPGGGGGGIFNTGGTLTIIGSTIANNETQVSGGGISSYGHLAIINSTVSGNRVVGTHDAGPVGDGGGISCSGPVTTITNSTISNNYASNSGGGISGNGTITHSTVSGNRLQSFSGSGGGISVTGDLRISHTILNSGIGANISHSFGAVYSLGYNLSNDDGGGFLTGPGDQINTDPEIGPLQYNGGPTLTHAPSNGSPAIDAGDPGFTPPPYEDQRGIPRVFNGRVDIGSIEVQPVSATPTPTPSGTPCGWVIRFNENFDGVTAPALPPGWTSSFTPGPAGCAPSGTCALGTNWASSNNDPYSPPHCVFHNAPGCVTDSVLVTPSFVPGPSNQAYLSIQQSFDLENGRDGAVLEISINDGPFVDFAAIGGYPGYTGTIASDSSSPLAGREAWTGNSGGYQNRSMTFPQAALFQNVRLRFRLATDCSGAGAGWRLDHIMVVDNLGCQPPSPTPVPPRIRALNISTRLRAETGDQVVIGGFIITGSTPKQVIVRGIGPSLAHNGITNPLADPILELHGPSGFPTVTNDNWRDTQVAAIQATGLPPTDDLESAIVATLAPGAYTAELRGKNNTTGVGLVEVYDTDQGADSQMANLSTRGFVRTGDSVMIGGFILGGGVGGTSVAVRGMGPSLSQSGLSSVLADPTLELRDSNGALLIANDNWQDAAASAAQLTAHGLAPQNPLESGIFASLPAGAFTAILAGKNGGVGIGLVEIYNVQ